MKKTVFILILFICAQAVFAAEYKDVFLGGGNTGMKAAEIGGTTYMPADALSLFGKDAVYQNGYLSVNNKYYSIRNIDERPYLLSDDFKEITGQRVEKVFEVGYAFQEIENLPEADIIPENQGKYWPSAGLRTGFRLSA